MSALKRLVALALSLLMLGLGGGALGETPSVVNYSDFLDSMTPQQAYDEYVDLLNLYLNNDPESAVDIEKLYFAFARVDYAYSFEFSLYTKVLYHLEQEDFTEATNWLIVLQINSDEFEKHLASEDFRLRYFNILDTETLSTYIEARREEAAHNASAAAILYERCLKFFDSMDRYTNNRVNPDVLVSLVQQQIADGDYAKAVENAQRLLDMGHHKAQALYAVASSKLQEATEITAAPAATIFATPAATEAPVIPDPTPAPSQPAVSIGSLEVKSYYNTTNISLSWDAVPGADEYRVYRARGEDGQYKQIATIKKTSYQDPDFVKGIFNGYYVKALSNGQVLKESKRFTVYAAVATPTPKPTPTATPAPVWGAWSGWSTNKVTANSTTQVETQIQYRSRNISQQSVYSDWSAWSNWSTTSASETNLQDVETKVEYEPIYKTVTTYSYSRWRYKKTTTGSWAYSYAKYTTTPANGGVYGGSGSWQYKDSTSPLSVDHYTDGRKVYAGIWYNEKKNTETVQDGSKEIVYYRTRTRTQSWEPQYGIWSDWTSSPISENSTTDVETRTVYRYRKYQ